jgi:DNA-binding transcriptional LysR family regulator
MSVDSLFGMQLFVRVVQAGSFSAAGRQVGLSPASVFRHINALEDSLGVKLLNRTSRRLSLTEAGGLYCSRLEHILSEIQDVNSEVSQLELAPRGTLRVHARVSIGSLHLAPILPAFLTKYPEMRIDLHLSDRVVDLVEENIDVALLVGKARGTSAIIRKLASSPRIVCASPGYLATHPAPVRPEDLAGHNCLTFRSEMGQPMWRFMQARELSEIRVSGNLQADNAEVLRVAALHDAGLALLPTWCIGPDLYAGRLRAVLTDYVATAFGFDDGIYVIYQKPRHRAIKTRLFLDYLVQSFRHRTDWSGPAAADEHDLLARAVA